MTKTLDTDSVPHAATEAYWEYVQEQDDRFSALCADALFEAAERQGEELDRQVSDGRMTRYERRSYVPGAGHGLLR